MENHAGTEGVAGVDESGRGPLAGPVVAAAVLLDPARPVPGLDDSKRLSARRREQLAEAIRADARAVAALDPAPLEVLVDGDRCPALDVRARAVVGGDGLEPAIAAASILAKVERDRLMCALDGIHPGYDFASHKGYGTRAHLDALQRLGPCDAHRRSFAPVRALLDQFTLDLTPATANHE